MTVGCRRFFVVAKSIRSRSKLDFALALLRARAQHRGARARNRRLVVLHR